MCTAHLGYQKTWHAPGVRYIGTCTCIQLCTTCGVHELSWLCCTFWMKRWILLRMHLRASKQPNSARSGHSHVGNWCSNYSKTMLTHVERMCTYTPWPQLEDGSCASSGSLYVCIPLNQDNLVHNSLALSDVLLSTYICSWLQTAWFNVV